MKTTIPDHDAWLIRRCLLGESLTAPAGQLARLAVEAMTSAGNDLDARDKALNAWLATLAPDLAEEIKAAIFSADPTGPEPPGPDADTFHLTEGGNGERLVAEYCQDLKYSKAFGWLEWDGRRWAPDDGRVPRAAKAVIATLFDEAEEARARVESLQAELDALAGELDQAKADKREELTARLEAADKWAKALFSHAMRSQRASGIKGMCEWASSDDRVRVKAGELDTGPWLLNCLNWTLDLEAGTLKPHCREDLISKLVPVAYNAGAACPTWIAFLDRVMAGNQQLIAFLQRAVGYSLTGKTGERVLFFLWGPGANGKTRFIEVLKALTGEYAKHTRPETLMVKRGEAVPCDVAALAGARVVTASETEDGQRLAESLIKQLTGGEEEVTARFLFKDEFTYVPAYKLWMAGNHKPRIKGTDNAIWDRVLLLPFLVTIPKAERDPALADKLRAELPGILAWAVEGCRLWQREGLNAPPEVLAATETYRQEEDVLAAFLADCCVELPSATAPAGELYEVYAKWCEANRERPETKIKLGRRLKERGFEQRIGTAGKQMWVGVGLRAESDRSDRNDLDSGTSPYARAGGKDHPFNTPVGKGSGNGVTSITSVTNPEVVA